MKDLGILLDERLSLIDHIRDKINKALLDIIRHNFKHLTIPSFIMVVCIRIWSGLI